MKSWQVMTRFYTALGMLLMLAACSKSWQEEVLLHDGSKIVIERTVDRGGRHEIGQQSPIKDQSITFTVPVTNELITWRSEFSEEVGLAEFQPLLLDIFQGVAYVVAHAVSCQTYNKLGRPNPPYVIFKYQDKEWRHITIQELPEEIKTPNLIFGSPDNNVAELGTNFVKVEAIRNINNRLIQPEFRTVMREPLSKERISEMCEERVLYKGHWILPNDPVARTMIDRRVKSN